MGQIHFDTTDPMAHTSHPHEWRFSMACGGKTSEKNYSLQVQDDDYMNKIQYFVRIGDSFLQYEYIGTTAPITTREPIYLWVFDTGRLALNTMLIT